MSAMDAQADSDQADATVVTALRGRLRLPPLVLYLMSASLVRCASGGAAVGLVSLTISAGHGAAFGASLAALLTAPYIAGPWLARVLDGTGDSRIVLAFSFAVFGVCLAGGALLLGHAPDAVIMALMVGAGLAGPLMTGGLSSRLAGIVGGRERLRRRAEGWDSATYGLSNIVGPAVVATIGAVAGPLTAVVVLGCGGLMSAVLVLTLPRQSTGPGTKDSLPVRAALRILFATGPLRRVLIATMLTAVSTGGIMVIAVVFGTGLGASAAAGAALATAYGVGSLGGAIAVALLPLRGEPEKLTIALIGANAGCVALCAAAPGYVIALVTFALAGASSAVLFTATLAVRSVYSPPGATAQVFVSMAGAKMAASSVGTALAGSLVVLGPRFALLVGATFVTVSVAIALIDRQISPKRASASTEPATVATAPSLESSSRRDAG